ncbi:MAG: hypothetical protein ACT4SY_13870 [Hyphomicrobiales bacterium]
MPPDLSLVEFWITLTVLTAGLALACLMAWLERRPRQSLNPRLVPTTPFLFAGTLLAILAFVHLLNLWGVHTGR